MLYLALHEFDDSRILSGSVVVGAEFAVPEDLDGRVSSDFEPSAGVFAALRAVNLDQVDGGIVLQEHSGGLLKLGLQLLAMATPGSERRQKKQ